ncbi:MAG: sulfate adenylyltransferase subunit 1 [Succinivibrionaceae bacterium]
MRLLVVWKEEREKGISKMSFNDKSKQHSLLKFITCGSVDDGKSTLIGHILYDSKLLYADQIQALELDSKIGSRGGKIDFSLLLDGLLAEREQGITIDVAYRYFTTSKRSFIVADTPGHEEYTRNMAVGASFADLAIILIDATLGVLVQTRRHARICSLMGIKYFVFAINKMDLIGFDENRFNEIKKQIDELQRELNLYCVQIIPVSATEGDNVTVKSHNTPWYNGPALVNYLEEVNVSEDIPEDGFYVPIQRVSRPNREFRGFQGQIESGVISIGEEVTTLPSGEKAHVRSILVGDKECDSARVGQPVTIQLDREVDTSRGCVLLRNANTIKVANGFVATILWMSDVHLDNNFDGFIKLGTKLISGKVEKINYSVDVNTGKENVCNTLEKNEIASCVISTSEPIVMDLFSNHKVLGEFILIDRVTNMTAACGIVTDILNLKPGKTISELRAQNIQQTGLAVRFLGIQKDLSIVAKAERELLIKGRRTYQYVLTENTDLDNSVILNLVNVGIVVLIVGDKGIDSSIRQLNIDINNEDFLNSVEKIYKESL